MRSFLCLEELVDDVQAATNQLRYQDVISIGQFEVKAYHTPCHTGRHPLCHYQDVLFADDTLFIARCGLFFNRNSSRKTLCT